MVERPIKVCLVAPLPPPNGGIARWTALITQYASRLPNIRLNVVDIAVRWRKVHDLSLLKRWFGGGGQLLRDLYRFAGQLVFHRPDLVHLTSAGQFGAIRDLVFVFVATILRVPVVYHLRFGRIPDISAAMNWEWRLIARVLRNVQAAIVLDAATEQVVRDRIPTLQVRTIPNCIDLAALPPVETGLPSSRRAVYIGWVIASKGMAELMQAWSALAKSGWILEIIGPVNPDYQLELMQAVSPEAVAFLGELPHEEVLHHLTTADIFILPSHTEGFPNVVLEAMALGKAIVATSVGAVPEMLAGGCGCLVRQGSVTDLQEALRYLVDHAETRTEMGMRARAKAQSEYSLEGVFASYRCLWEWTINAGASR